MKVVGIDVGGTGMKGAVADLHGRIVLERQVATEASQGAGHVRDQFFSLLDQLVSRDIAAIGIATAGRVDVEAGKVVYATNNLPGWNGFSIRQAVEERYRLPVYVDNDVNAAALGEWWETEADERMDAMVFISIGTGIGAGIIYQGEVMHGHHWSSGEIGHMILHPDGIPCNCGKRGCLEQYVSASALVRNANQVEGGTYQNAEQVFRAYQQGDPQVKPVVRSFAADLSLALCNLQNVLDPPLMVIGGGVSMAHHVLNPLLQEKLAGAEVNVPICWSRAPAKAGLLGAARLALMKL